MFKRFIDTGRMLMSASVKSEERGVSLPTQVMVRVEDDRTGMSEEAFRRAFFDHLYYLQGVDHLGASDSDHYRALSYVVRDRLVHRWIETMRAIVRNRSKTVCYLSAEFLLGRQLGNNILNVGCWRQAQEAVKAVGADLESILSQEPDPGLGNGGLGRLAACYLDSLATLGVPAIGYGIRYEFGIFEQQIRDGRQVELPDMWAMHGSPWEIRRPEEALKVCFGGHTEGWQDEAGRDRAKWVPTQEVLGIPHDIMVPGYGTNVVNTLRLWGAHACKQFDFERFNSGDFIQAVADKALVENLSKVLYPNDSTQQGIELRFKQQYFFVSCSLQDMLRNVVVLDDLERLSDYVAVQLNDTHPSIAVAELMRLLIDVHGFEWDRAWDIVRQTISFTNHTLLSEALETWSVDLFSRLLPRHLEIIYDINHKFLKQVETRYPNNFDKMSNLSLVAEGAQRRIRMAHLACVGSRCINGVAALHTELLKEDVLKDFYELWPEKFTNITNGVTPRRWLMLSNPRLTSLITSKIGKGWIRDLSQLRELEKHVEDDEFVDSWVAVKSANKQELVTVVKQLCGIDIDPSSLFDVQVKRIHEYKRQLLLVLYAVTIFNRIKQNPSYEILPRTILISGKAAPGYYMAKSIIHLINSVAAVINSDKDVAGRLKVVFLPNFSVSLGEKVYPAAELSEQISMAGKEASGTGNMKFALNGALTIGTYDGANIEIRECVGEENFFLFGYKVHELANIRSGGYNPRQYYNSDEELREVVNRISSGFFSGGRGEVFQPIVESLLDRRLMGTRRSHTAHLRRPPRKRSRRYFYTDRLYLPNPLAVLLNGSVR